MPCSHYVACCTSAQLVLRHVGFNVVGARALAAGFRVRKIVAVFGTIRPSRLTPPTRRPATLLTLI